MNNRGDLQNAYYQNQDLPPGIHKIVSAAKFTIISAVSITAPTTAATTAATYMVSSSAATTTATITTSTTIVSPTTAAATTATISDHSGMIQQRVHFQCKYQ